MRDAGVQRLADLTRIDPAVSDAYNAEGYWDYLTVRGFVARQPLQLPPRRPADQRRDLDPARQQGAHRAAEGHERHAGRHQRAGRPGQPRRQAPARRAAALGDARLARARQRARLRSTSSQRFGDRRRVRRARQRRAEHLDPHAARRARQPPPARRSPATGASAPTRWSKPRSRPAIGRSRACPASACSAARVPAHAIDPRINLNNQPWSLPVVFDGDDGVAALARSG